MLERVMDEAVVAVCAEAVGAMAALNERTVEYAKTRLAFGQTISRFQAIQHRLVDMHVSHEHAGAITLKGALAQSQGAQGRARAASAAKVLVDQEAGFVGKNAIQLHGAIGMTEELDVGHYFRRITMIRALYGSADHHLRRYMALARGGKEDADGLRH